MTDQAYPDALQPQHRLHWYTIERVLGQGGFGITYLARDTNLDQLVAIKEYLPVEVALRRPDATVRSRSDGQRDRYRWGLDRFIQEARTLARFDHPNIVRVHSVFEFNGTAYMVMRFEEGENFGALLERRGTLPEKDVLRVLLPILDGLELVHNAGFIHRDVKPDNIHIRADGSPVLLDFGSARHALGKARTLTILVAPGYAPFEQYNSNSENQGPWTDIYGLGATCYRAIAGTPPLDAISRSKGILGSTREILVPASTIGSGRYSGQLLRAIDRALEFDEKRRPQSVSEWRKELAGESGVATAPSVEPQRVGEGVALHSPAPPASAASAVATAPPAAAAPSGWSGARAPIAWAVAGAVAGAIAIAVFLRVSQPVLDPKAVPPVSVITPGSGDTKDKPKEAAPERKPPVDDAQPKLEPDPGKPPAKPEEKGIQVPITAPSRGETGAPKPKVDKLQPKPVVPKSVPPRPDVRPPPKIPSVPTPAPIEPVDPEVSPVPKAPAKPRASDMLEAASNAEARGDFPLARQILTDLAAGGNATAQAKLAEMYANGRGVAVNYFQAYIWYSLAVRCGNTAAAAGKAGVTRNLQQAQVNQADTVVAGMKACK